MRVALVHDWLTGMRGGEFVLEAMLDVFPNADIFTLLHVPGSVSPLIESRPISTSFLNRAPNIASTYRWYLPLFPFAIESLRVRDYDLVVSSSHCAAKAVRTGGTPHLCYCHTPVRYAWGQFDSYFSSSRRRPLKPLAYPAAAALRAWDRSSSARVNSFVANSNAVRDRIKDYYGRSARVVHPPVQLSRFTASRAPEDFYLIVSALVPYKRIDLAIAAAKQAKRRLVIVGSGPELPRLRAQADANIEFRGHVSNEEVATLYSRCRAFIMPGEEDFGITTVEAQAAGAPVIAFRAGGALDSVTPSTGVFFDEATAPSLADAMFRFEKLSWNENAIRENAQRFAPGEFTRGFRAAVEEVTG